MVFRELLTRSENMNLDLDDTIMVNFADHFHLS